MAKRIMVSARGNKIDVSKITPQRRIVSHKRAASPEPKVNEIASIPPPKKRFLNGVVPKHHTPVPQAVSKAVEKAHREEIEDEPRHKSSRRNRNNE